MTVQIPDSFSRFLEQRSQNFQGSQSDYVQDLIRQDFEREADQWSTFMREIQAGLEATDEEFEVFDPDTLIAEAKAEKARRHGG